MEITGIENNINKLAPEKEVRVAPVNDPAVNADPVIVNKSANTIIEQDGTKLNSVKGKIPASGLMLTATSDTPSYVKNAEEVIQEYSTDIRKLQIIDNLLQKLNLNEGLDNLNNEDLMALMMIGIDIQVDAAGQVSITEICSGDQINPADFAKVQGNLDNTVKRTIAQANTLVVTTPVNIVGASTVSPAAQEALITVLKDYKADVKYNKEVVEPKNKELDENIKQYEAVIAEIQKQTDKIDGSITKIVDLRTQAEKIIEKAKTGKISEDDKKTLVNLASNMELRQKELKINQQGSQLLMNQAEQTFAQFAPNLSESEKSTKELMQNSLKAKITGQALSIEQIGVDNIVKEIYKRTASMGDAELNVLIEDKDARLKLMADMNKFFDRMGTATQLSDLSDNDINTLSQDYHIKAVQENGKLEFYYYATEKAEPVKVSKEDIRGFKNQLNNIVNSPELFQLARAAGQISLAYDKDGVNKKSVEAVIENSNNPKEKTSSNTINDGPAKHEENTSLSSTRDEETKQKVNKWNEQAELDKSIQKKRDEEKYHEKQIDNIHENRREINKYLDKKRAERELEKS
jgi:hypothetical protein